MWRSFILLVVLLTGCVQVLGYSNGKVGPACGDMTPQHRYESSPDPPPYTITVDKSTFSPGEKITGGLSKTFAGYSTVTHQLMSLCSSSSTVSLQVASSKTTFFKGFLIEARDAGKLDFPAGGLFILTDPHESQLLQCGGAEVHSSSFTLN